MIPPVITLKSLFRSRRQTSGTFMNSFAPPKDSALSPVGRCCEEWFGKGFYE